MFIKRTFTTGISTMNNKSKIWKYRLEITDDQTLYMPVSAKFLTVQFQGLELCLWAEVPSNTDVQHKNWHIYVVGTGNPMPDPSDPLLGLKHIGTVQQAPFVWHVYCEEPILAGLF